LKFPDGVRLMDRPAQYRGGVSRRFMRAEQAANVGREIGLQYVHAHIRYIEALAKIGADEKNITEAFDVINPVDLKVPKAVRRQRNAYFSSSDAAFTTRYEAQERWNELKEGKIPVKGGWRIYSSGPGIWLNQLMTNVLGIRERSDGLLLDPVITGTIQMDLFDIPCRIRITRGGQRRILWNGELLNLSNQSNRYRQGGYLLQREALKTILPSGNELQIELPL
ncbi:MAG: cellobiose phosphorylase, partial [Exiguobacterium indicum]